MNLPSSMNPGSEPTSPEKAIPDEVMSWLSGNQSAAPAEMSKMMSDISNKMSWYIAWILVQRMSNLNGVMTYLKQIETQLFQPREDARRIGEVDLRKDYKLINETLTEFLEFSRKFAVQSKDLISDPSRDKLSELIRSLDEKGIAALTKSVEDQIKSVSGGASPKRGIDGKVE